MEAHHGLYHLVCMIVCTCVCEHVTVQVLFEVQALGDFPGEEEEDLGFKDREILTILESRYGYLSDM